MVASFLRKRVTLSKKDPSPSFISTPDPLERSSDAPPVLPPLILSSSLADPEPTPSAPPPLPPAASAPVVSLPAPDLLDDVWDPWKDARNAPTPRLDAAEQPKPKLPVHSPQSVRSSPIHVPKLSDSRVILPNSVATAPASRNMSSKPAQPVPRATHHDPKSDPPGNHSFTQSPRRQPPRPSSLNSSAGARGRVSFDFEESLSAANVPSVVNQVRSYPPPIRHHPSPAAPSHMATQQSPAHNSHRHHTPPQKPGSSSSLSSSSHHTDATRRTSGSYATSTSASSVPSLTEVNSPSLVARLDAVGSTSYSSRPSARNISSQLPSHTSRHITPSHVSTRVHRPQLPPTSYPDRVKSLSKPSSHASQSGHSDAPMLYDILRSGNPQSVVPLRKGPLIFSAMSQHPTNPYSSPPSDHASLNSSPSSHRKTSISSGFRQIDSHPPQAPAFSPASHLTELPPLARKSSKSSLACAAPEHSRGDAASADHARPRVLTKARPTTPQRPSTSSSHKVLPEPGDPLLLDDDPFARVEGVKMLRPRAQSGSRSIRTPSPTSSLCISKECVGSSEDGHIRALGTLPPSVPKPSLSTDTVPEMTPSSSTSEQSPLAPLTPPDDYKVARQQRRGQWLEKVPPPAVAEIVAQQQTVEVVEEPPREPTPPPTYFPIVPFLSDPNLLPLLLSRLSYSEWLALYSANKQVRELFKSRILREFVLERYLGTVGYSKWTYEWAEPLELSLKDLHSYLRGVAMPAHHYARLAADYLLPKVANRDAPTTETPDILTLALTTRAYTRVVLRLRAQAESEVRYLGALQPVEPAQARNTSYPGTRQPSVSSRAPSPTSSNSHSHNHSHRQKERNSSLSSAVSRFRSPLYRIGRAPVLRVFVPSPEGDWLSDASVMECEAELKRSGILKLLRVGDIVWDIAVGDEGNLGRLIWDGSYLVDLDYRYSRVGELSPYFHSMAFSPSYFHRVIRIGGSANHNPNCNPIVYVDISPWGREIASNLQLLQDRARTETPHGALHDVVRWVHRSQFTIRAPVAPSQGQNRFRRPLRIPIPSVDGFYIDPGWYGKVILESEGTNEGLADLQARCGPGVFPPRAESLATKIRNEKEKENRRVWRIVREKSRPGELWLRAVQVKERLM